MDHHFPSKRAMLLGSYTKKTKIRKTLKSQTLKKIDFSGWVSKCVPMNIPIKSLFLEPGAMLQFRTLSTKHVGLRSRYTALQSSATWDSTSQKQVEGIGPKFPPEVGDTDSNWKADKLTKTQKILKVPRTNTWQTYINILQLLDIHYKFFVFFTDNIGNMSIFIGITRIPSTDVAVPPWTEANAC